MKSLIATFCLLLISLTASAEPWDKSARLTNSDIERIINDVRKVIREQPENLSNIKVSIFLFVDAFRGKTFEETIQNIYQIFTPYNLSIAHLLDSQARDSVYLRPTVRPQYDMFNIIKSVGLLDLKQELNRHSEIKSVTITDNSPWLVHFNTPLYSHQIDQLSAKITKPHEILILNPHAPDAIMVDIAIDPTDFDSRLKAFLIEQYEKIHTVQITQAVEVFRSR